MLLCLAPVLDSKAQLPCDSIEASLITCSPGDEVYSLYGHTALRCRNFTRKADVAFNYGVFSFGQPHFLWRFILGQCDYMVLGIPWDVFIKEYEERDSRVTQQPLNLTSEEANRLWAYLVEKALEARHQIRWTEMNKKDVNRLVNVLLNDTYQIAGRAPFKDEFVTCGGVSLKAVNPSTLESRHVPHLYFAGEVLDIDGITGGFNFQAAWTTAFTVACAIADNR